MTGLEETFYIMAIVFMGLTFVMLLVLVGVALVIRSKINKIHAAIEKKLNTVTSLAEKGGELSALAGSTLLKQVRNIIKKSM